MFVSLSQGLMNHPEARALLLNDVRLRMTVKYAEWLPLVGKEILSHVQGATGVAYVIDVEVSPVNENDPSLVVTLNIFEDGGRWWLPPTETASFTITPDDRVMYLPDDLSAT